MIDVMVWVLKHSEAKHSNRLVLLALAEYAHQDGSKAFPSNEELEDRTKLSERQVQDCIRFLRKGGAIEHEGHTRSGRNIWRVLMTPVAAALGGVQSSRGADSRIGGVQKTTSRGAESRDAHIKEPSTTRQENRGRRSAPTREEAPLSHLLADLIEARDPDSSRPNVTRRWAEAEDRLQRLDERPAAQVEVVIRWVQADAFWQDNILSMPKLREKYRSVLGKALKQAPADSSKGKPASRADNDIRRLEEVKRRLEEEEGKR